MSNQDSEAPPPEPESEWPLDPEEYQRYGRQMIVPEFGLQGQLSLRTSSVLIIGLGGLGCPAANYLGGAGVSRIGLIDPDTVELSNLHRQPLHSVATVGAPKVRSAAEAILRLNPKVQCDVYHEALGIENAEPLFKSYDLLLDCTDHPAIRYLISDIAVRCGKTVVSGAALGTNGQLLVLNHPPRPRGDLVGGPCYRCIFPKPPPAAASPTCGEAGILGPVVGVVGVLMALRAVQVLTKGKQEGEGNEMMIFSAFPIPSFRSVRIRGRKSKCTTCGSESSGSRLSDADYVQFCSAGASPTTNLEPGERIKAAEYSKSMYGNKSSHTLLDVREKPQFDIAKLDGSINLPFSEFQAALSSTAPEQGDLQEVVEGLQSNTDKPVVVLCKQGNDSQSVVRSLKDEGWTNVRDIEGGLESWRKDVDGTWPEY
ncbi:MAG: Urmylation protein [Vezdaea aestivalis]|nr:MAG: Urmylation protein [Vezdaea aestivalis]